MSRTWFVSAMPSSQGSPACLIDESGEAPVPPSWPLIRMTSAWALATPGGDRPDAHLGHELDGDPGVRVGVLEVVDQLGQVLDGVDVVVRGRADQAHARSRVADLGDPGVDLVPGQLAALAGLGALGHLDLDLAGAHEVLAGHAEAARGDLLDGALAASRRWAASRSGPDPRRPRRCSTWRRGGSWRWRAPRGPRGRWSRSSSRPVLKRLTIDSTGSTSSIDSGWRWFDLKSISPRRVHRPSDWSSIELGVLLEGVVVAAPGGELELGDARAG